MRDLRNELNIDCPRAKGGYLEDAPEEIWNDPEWCLEPKIDGERWTLQIGEHRSMLVGRNRHDKLKGVDKAGPFVVQDERNPKLAAVESTPFAGTILDGECTEVFKQNGEYDKATKYRFAEDGWVGYQTWGVLFSRGVDVRTVNEEERYFMAALAVASLNDDRIRLIRRCPATKLELRRMFDEGLEGAVAKHLKKEIPMQRTNPNWWKLKGEASRTIDAFVIGVTEGSEGGSGVNGVVAKPNGKVASFVVGMYTPTGKIVEVAKVGDAIPDEDVERGLHRFWLYEGRVMEIIVSGWDGQAFRWPRLKKWRTDKTKFDCTVVEQIGAKWRRRNVCKI